MKENQKVSQQFALWSSEENQGLYSGPFLLDGSRFVTVMGTVDVELDKNLLKHQLLDTAAQRGGVDLKEEVSSIFKELCFYFATPPEDLITTDLQNELSMRPNANVLTRFGFKFLKFTTPLMYGGSRAVYVHHENTPIFCFDFPGIVIDFCLEDDNFDPENFFDRLPKLDQRLAELWIRLRETFFLSHTHPSLSYRQLKKQVDKVEKQAKPSDVDFLYIQYY